jgi:mono/diheme cytochrome c family protein
MFFLTHSLKMTKLALLILAATLYSCGNYEEFKEDPSALFSRVAPDTALTFEQVNNQVLTPKCVKCHPGYSDFDTVKADLDKIVSEVRSDSMPKDGPLSEQEKQLLFSWIFAGAPRGDVSPGPAPVKPGPTFDTLVQGVFGAKCIACHRVNPDDPNDRGEAPFALNDRTDLMVYATQFNPFVFDFEFPEESEFVKRFTSDNPVERMPPERSGFEPLTEEERELVIEWIRKGLP